MSEKKKPFIYFEQGLETIFEILCIEPNRADYLLDLGIKLLFENDNIAVAMEMLAKECQNHQEITWAMYCLGTSVTLEPDEQVVLLSESEFFNNKIERK